MAYDNQMKISRWRWLLWVLVSRAPLSSSLTAFIILEILDGGTFASKKMFINCSSLSDKSFWDSNVASSSRGGWLWCSKELLLWMYHCMLELRINTILIGHHSSEDAARWVTHHLALVVWLSFILCFLCLDFFSAVIFCFIFDLMQSIPNVNQNMRQFVFPK